ncbi:hypothetical protein P7K49_032194 [Saguinus oedipus]|uniref:Uncharacterized protein n=1 Tax=Saguinus oedipus TaxID=9490 RepID=A0ABQ9TYT0_SAGOE|nr:hypothetical protein P7K49_032194 [Saguinus oedipus]
MSALWKIKRKPRIENNDKSGDSIYRTLHLKEILRGRVNGSTATDLFEQVRSYSQCQLSSKEG